MHRFSWRLAVLGLMVVAGCRPEFQLKKFTTNEELYKASLRQFDRGKWDDAAAGFEKLTVELAPRDTLAARSFWYLGLARQHQRDHLRAAQSFHRIFESYPDDSLAERALFEEGRSYQSLWTRPDRDASYGDAALSTYSSVGIYYPTSRLKDSIAKEVGTLEGMFAQKHFDIGMYYFRDKAYDSANLSFRLVLETWPNAPRAREAALRLIDSYRALSYNEEAKEICVASVTKHPNDAEITKACPLTPVAAAKPPTAGDTIAAR